MSTSASRARTLGLLAFVLVSACGGGEEPEPAGGGMEAIDAQIEEAEAIIDRELARVEREEASTFPCSAFTQAEMEALAGDSLAAPMYAFLHKTENESAWRAESCDWLEAKEGGTSVSLWVSRPEHFDSGQVECYWLGGELRTEGLESLPGVREARWDFPGFGRGTLRVCADRALVEVLVDRGDEDEGAAFETARGVVEKTLGSGRW
ncbi:MAG TPA: hypothetical protein VJP59_11560 [Gemmatimonadota bacterium]|nr:hypothetical protein [Gemmatimonadota bacterium]